MLVINWKSKCSLDNEITMTLAKLLHISSDLFDGGETSQP